MLAENLETLRPLLFKTAYKMTGNVEDGKDIAQKVISDYMERDQASKEDIRFLKAYLVKSTINSSLNLLKKQKAERELYKGFWLPEPSLSNEWGSGSSPLDTGYAFLVLLSQLNPKERAVFILRESFDYSFKEIGEFLEMEETNCRQLYHRAAPKLEKKSRLQKVELDQQKSLTYAFRDAARSGNVEALLALLKEDIVLYSDGGGKAAAALNPIFGAKNVLALLSGTSAKNGGYRMELIDINGQSGFAVLNGVTGACDTLMFLETEEDQVTQIYLIRNPDKIHYQGEVEQGR